MFVADERTRTLGQDHPDTITGIESMKAILEEQD